MIFNKLFSKRVFLINIILCVLSLLGLTSCGEFLKGKPEQTAVLEVKQASGNCLKEIAPRLTKFLKSDLSDAEIDKTFVCFDQLITDFQTKVEGRERADAFNGDELYQIFNQFLEDSKISREAINEILVLKTAILGGSSQSVTKIELGQLKDLLKVFKTELKNLSPHIPVISFTKAEKPSRMDEIDAAFKQLKLSLKAVMKNTNLLRRTYRLEDLRDLFYSLNLFTEDQAPYISLIEKINSLITGAQNIMSIEDRETYIENIADAMRIYSLKVNGYIELSMERPNSLAKSLDFINECVSFIESTLQFKKAHRISVETIDPVLTSVHKANILPLNLKLDTLLNFYKTIFVRVYKEGRLSDVNGFKGIEAVHLTNIKRELAIFRISSELIAKISWNPQLPPEKQSNVSTATIRKGIQDFNPKALVESAVGFDLPTKNKIIEGLNQFKKFALKNHPTMYYDKKLVITDNELDWSQGWQDLMMSLRYMLIARQLVLGWGDMYPSTDMTKNYLSEAGLSQWYEEFRDFGIETKMFDPRDINEGPGTLKSADIFTWTAKTDGKLDFDETVEQLALLKSAGMVLTNKILDDAEKAKCQLNEMDVFGNHWNSEACVIKLLRRNYKQYFVTLPYEVRFLDQLTDEQFELYYYSLVELSRKNVSTKGIKVETSDISGMLSLMHYIETIFVTYDKDRSLSLDETELKAAYQDRLLDIAAKFAETNPDLKKGLKKMMDWKGQSLGGYWCWSKAEIIEEIFIHTILNRKPITDNDIRSAVVCVRGHFLTNEAREIEYVNRYGLISTFKFLKTALKSP